MSDHHDVIDATLTVVVREATAVYLRLDREYASDPQARSVVRHFAEELMKMIGELSRR